MTTDRFSTADALKFGWATWRTHTAPLLMLGVIGVMLAAISQALGRDGAGGALLSLPVQLLELAIMLQLLRVSLRLYDGLPAGQLGLDQLKGYWRFVFTAVVFGLAVSLGFALLIVPGVWFALTFGFAPLLTAEGERGLGEAFRESRRLTFGAKGQLFVLGVVLLALNFAGVLALGVGLVFTVPLSCLAVVYVFRRLQGRPEPATSQAPSLTARTA
jgi:uncharacterized membrane protein